MNNYCQFVTDSINGFGLVHCQADAGHKGEHVPPRSVSGPMCKKDAVWRKYEVAPAFVGGGLSAEVPSKEKEFTEDELYGGGS